MERVSPKYITFRDIIIIIVTSTVALMLSMHLSLFMDESFTMSLIRHSYSSIVQLDSLDVHPPLYYLVLKLFLSIITLGHQNLVIDIVLARLFSFTCFGSSFIVMCLTLRYMKIYCNVGLLYVILTAFMMWIQEVADIRMYPLAILFIVLEFYNIVKYLKSHKNKYLIGLTLFAILAAYTHYYSAAIAGLLILLLFIHALIVKSRTMCKWVIYGIILFLAYLPWLRVLWYQTTDLPSHYWILMSWTFRDSLEFLIILLLATPVLLQLNKLESIKNIYKLIINACIIILLMELILSFHRPIFILRYVSPLLFIYISMTFGLYTKLYVTPHVDSSNNHYFEILILLFLVVLGANCVYTGKQSQNQFHHQSVMLINKFNNRAPKYVTLDVRQATQGNIRHLCQFNTYAQYNHKLLSHREVTTISNNKLLKQGTSSNLMYKLWKTN